MVISPISNRHIEPLEGDVLPGSPIQPFLKNEIVVEASPWRARSSSRLVIQLAAISLGSERYILVNRTEPVETDCVEFRRKLQFGIRLVALEPCKTLKKVDCRPSQ